MTRYETISVIVPAGTVLTSSKGFIYQSSLGQKWYSVKKLKFEGNGIMTALWDKEEIDVNPVTP